MRKISLAFIAFWLFVNLASASPANPVEGAEYKALTTPQAVTAPGKKIEVIEFFMYHCPACYKFEAPLQAWLKKQGDNVVFRRMHLPHNGNDDVESHMFLTLEAMQLEDKMHAKILNLWHVEHHRLTSDSENIDWAEANGIDRAQFVAIYNSFAVVSKLHNLLRVAESYQVNSTPTLVIDGRYITGPGMIEASNPKMPFDAYDQAVLQVADFLVEKAKASK